MITDSKIHSIETSSPHTKGSEIKLLVAWIQKPLFSSEKGLLMGLRNLHEWFRSFGPYSNRGTDSYMEEFSDPYTLT